MSLLLRNHVEFAQSKVGPLLRIAEGQSCDVSSISSNHYSTHLAIQQSDPYADVLVSRRVYLHSSDCLQHYLGNI